jgi:hypothetical protein
LDANFRNTVTEINKALSKLAASKSLESGIKVATRVLEVLGLDEMSSADEVIDNGLLKLPNSERQDPWFHPHPWMRGERAAFELVDSDSMPVQAKFFWLQKRGNAYVAGGVHFTKNWEDHDFTRTDEFKVGIDFFLTQDVDAVLVVLSNRGKLRVMELSNKVSNTQLEIFESWFQTRNIQERNKFHTSLWESFKLQAVNAKFYDGVADSFTELLVHLRNAGKDEEEAKLFASRMLGRLIFVWFLRKMGAISSAAGYFEASAKNPTGYYRQDLERLFFRTLNTPIGDRAATESQQLDLETPYLNGGLFAPHPGDWLQDPTLSFPEFFFERIFEHFENFNFTTDESTPEYEQVAIDPEMLGRVFESLLASQISATGEQARKAKGAFYTPREVVAHMCKESVRSYLLNESPHDEILRKAVSKLLDTSDQDWTIAGSNSLRDIGQELRVKLSTALSAVKTLDPACGSGAFPLGMVQLLTKLHVRLDPRLDQYILKLSILRENIFGVDIEPMAIEISRLRAWLSLIVEEQRGRHLEPLPNLDFNFVCANSLISLDGPGLFTDMNLQVQLAELRRKYFIADSREKKKEIQGKYFYLTQPGLLDEIDSRAAQLKSFNPFDADHVSGFFDAEHMFGIRDGFNIILGNPPYIGMQGHAELFKSVRNTKLGRRFFSGKMDYFYFFFHLGLDLLKHGGVLSLITTNYFPTASYAKKLVEDIRERATVLSILNFSEVRIFDSAAGQHNMITTLARGYFELPASVVQVKNTLRGRIEVEDLSAIISGYHPELVTHSIPQSRLFKNGILAINSQGDSPVDGLLDKMAQSNVTLGRVAHINQGVVTGADKVSKSHISKFGAQETLLGAGIFVLSEEELQALNLDEHEKQIIKPWFKNSDIRRFATSLETQKYLIYADERDGSLESRPKLRSHLEAFGHLLQVGRSSKYPYLTRPRSIEFNTPKIVAPQRSTINKFGYSESDWYASGDVYFISEKSGSYNLFTLLGLLNSDLYLAWFYLRGKRKGEMMEFYQMPLTLLPLPQLNAMSAHHLEKVSQLSSQIWMTASSGLEEVSIEVERALNDEVMSAFGFSEGDTAELKSWKTSWLSRFENSSINDAIEEIDDD